MATKFEDSFSEEIWFQTYKDHTDNTIDDTFKRVADAIASVEQTPELQEEWAGKFYDMLPQVEEYMRMQVLSLVKKVQV